MKKHILMAIAAAIFSIATVNAQGGFQRKTVEERVKETMDKLVDFKLEKSKSDQAETVFTDFYKAQQKMMEDMMAAGGQIDREAMRTQRQKLADDRDTKLKTIFTDDQYKKWKDEIEPSLRPQRPNRQQ